MATNEYHFVTDWRVRGAVEEVSEILEDALGLPRWWPSVYLEVEELEPGDASGTGRVIGLLTKGWLPYTLRWKFRITESNHPHGFSLHAFGDFEGTGVWTFTQDGEFVHIIYNWRIRADKPLLKALSFLLKPIFSANHRWAMARGLDSLKLELERRHARTPEEAAKIPPPPAPTFPHNLRHRKRRALAPVSTN
jgi:hypothetical protein